MKTIVIAVVGSKNCGKTKAIEALTKELIKRGCRVAAVKHIPEPNFTIDTEGKDTWRFAKAGAKTIVSVASNEIVTIEKIDTTGFSLEEILQRCRDADAIFLEGFKKLVSKRDDVPKIVLVESAEEALEALKTFKPMLAFTGFFSTENLNLEVPYIDVFKNPEKIVDIVGPLPEGNNDKLIVKINGKNLALYPFVQNIIRKTLLAMLSTLKGAEIQGDESVEIKIKGAGYSAF